MVSDAARAIAQSPFVELDLGTFMQRVDCGDVAVVSSAWPIAGVVVPLGGGPQNVEAAVEDARSTGRRLGESTLAWWIAPRHDRLAPALEKLGLVHSDAPGFEAIETAMVLQSAPSGSPGDGVDVRVVETYEDFLAGAAVLETAFGLPRIPDETNRRFYTDYAQPGNRARQFLALLDGEPVGTAFAVFGDGAVNLFGGGVLPDARGRGVYRALTHARWDAATEIGTPALTVQAGRQSRPILDALGFEPLLEIRLFVDRL
jgi:GNAT superfamily N-acetyltransferase